MTSAICQVKDGSGSYQSTINGVDVTASNTITIKLYDTSGVITWSITCLNTDDLHSSATINSGLTVNQINKTATFTAPSDTNGSALIFKSTVNLGLTTENVVTFGIFTLTGTLARVGAVGETTEGSALFGWITKSNNIARSYGTNIVKSGDFNITVSGLTTILSSNGITLNDDGGAGISIISGGGSVDLHCSGVQLFDTGSISVFDNGTTTGTTLTLISGASAAGGGIAGDVIIKAGTGASYSGNIALGGPATYAAGVNGGSGVIFIAKDAADPGGNPVNGIVLYVDSSGNLKARTSAGNVRTIAAV